MPPYASTTIEQPGLARSPQEKLDEIWTVTVYDNDHNTYAEVIAILIVATGCTEEEAYVEAWEVDHLGQSVVHHADEEECRGVAEIIRTIGIAVEVSSM